MKAERVATALTSMADGLLLGRTSAVGTVKLISSEAKATFVRMIELPKVETTAKVGLGGHDGANNGDYGGEKEQEMRDTRV